MNSQQQTPRDWEVEGLAHERSKNETSQQLLKKQCSNRETVHETRQDLDLPS